MKRYIFCSILIFFISTFSYACEQKPLVFLDAIMLKQALQNSKKFEEKKFCLKNLKEQLPPIISMYLPLEPKSSQDIHISHIHSEVNEGDKTFFRSQVKYSFVGPIMRCISQENVKKRKEEKNIDELGSLIYSDGRQWSGSPLFLLPQIYVPKDVPEIIDIQICSDRHIDCNTRLHACMPQSPYVSENHNEKHDFSFSSEEDDPYVISFSSEDDSEENQSEHEKNKVCVWCDPDDID